MAIRVSGLVSGLDTDSIVQELVSAYSTKKDKHVKAQTKLEWKMDAWKELNKKVNSLYKKLGNMRLSSYYTKKTTTISDSTKATVAASNNAINGSQTLKVLDVASTGYITGAQLKKGATAGSTLKDLNILADGEKGTVALKTKNGTANIEITSDMSVSDFVNKLKEGGVSASYDSTYNRLYISAKDSGADNDFALTATDSKGLDVLKGLGIYVNSEANKKAYDAWDKYSVDVDGNPTTDPDKIKANFKKILETISDYQGNGTGSIKDLETQNAKLRTDLSNLQADGNYANAFISMKAALAVEDENGNSKLDASEQAEMERLLRMTGEKTGLEEATFNTLKEKLGYSDEDFAQLQANASAVEAYETDEDADNQRVKQEINDAYDAAGSVEGLRTWVSAQNAKIADTASDIEANSAEIARQNAYIQKHALLTSSAPVTVLTDEQKADMSADEIAAVEAKNDIDARVNSLWAQYDYIQNTAKADTDYSDTPRADGSQAHRVDGTDARIELNGVEYKSASNSITVNGLTVTALQKTAPGETLTITTQSDVQATYDRIKDFLKEYNALIKEMDELYNAESSKGYEPLTDDEKDAMSDKEVERWEEKIKKSLLRRDGTLSTVMNLMTSTMSQGFTLSDGKRYSLASFGIKTQGYLSAAENEGYLYHIDGDSEDEVSSGNADKLLAALQEDPERVQEFFQTLTDDLYTKLDKKMQSTSMNSKYSIYNDKKMKSDYDQYTKTIKKWEEKVTSMEDYYYKKFTAMEKALSTLQQSTSALSGLLGS